MKKLLLATTVILAGFAMSTAAMAQSAGTTVPDAETNIGGTEPTNIPGHPGVSEVDQRDDNQQNAINKGLANGSLTQGQAARDQAHLDAQEASQAQQEADHGGHLTGKEYSRDNRSLNKSVGRIDNQRGLGPSETKVGGVEPTHIPGHGRVDEIDQRDDNQQNAINKGLADGQLTKGEAARDQARLDRQEAQQKSQEAHDGGHLTKAEQRNDNKWLNKTNGNIQNQRGVAPSETKVGGIEPTHVPGHPGVNEVDKRDNNQERRIHQGLADHQLTKAEAGRDQATLNRQEAAQKRQEAHNGGRLTKREYRGDNRSLNKSSRNIHRQRKAGQ